MTSSMQPVAGNLSAVLLRACQHPDCPHFQRNDCPEHAQRQDLGVVAAFDHRTEAKPQ